MTHQAVSRAASASSAHRDPRTAAASAHRDLPTAAASADRDRRTTARGRRGLRRLCAAVLLGAVAITVQALATADYAGAAQQRWLITMIGRGYGHGVGMSQYGAQGMAKAGKSYKEILGYYYRGISFGSTKDRDIRVLLTSGQSPVRITSASSFSVKAGPATYSIGAGVTASITRSGSLFRVAAGGSTWTSTAAPEFRPGGSLLRLVNRSLIGWSTYANLLYRGRLTVAHSSSLGLCTVNTLPMESYLRGVVSREMSSSWHQQALRAQAVAARTFAVRRIGSSGLFDLYCDTRSQAYGGASGETQPTTAAVTGTKGVIATYGGSPIQAFYFASSGGRTENCENVFWATLPYLKSVADPYDAGSPYHTWPENPLRWTSSALRSKLGSGSLPSGGLQALYVVRRGASPRVLRALAVSAKGATALSGATARARLGLRDTWFSVRSMSVVPGEGARIKKGARLVLRGTTYPALSKNARLKLFYYRGGRWRSVRVPSANIKKRTRTVTAAGTTYKLTYSTYAYSVRPGTATTYRFVVGSYRSPKTVVKVGGPAPSPTPTPTPTPTPAPTETTTPSPDPSVSPQPSPSPSPSASAADSLKGKAVATHRVRRGATARLRCVLLGPDGAAADLVVKIRLPSGKAVKTVLVKDATVGGEATARFRCWLKRGRYRYYVYAVTADGVWQTASPSSRPLIVK